MAVQVLDRVEVVRSDPLLHPAVLPHHISRGIRGYDFHCHSAKKRKKKKKIAETSIFSPISQFSSGDFYPASLPSAWSCCIHCDNSVQYKSGTLLHLTSNAACEPSMSVSVWLRKWHHHWKTWRIESQTLRQMRAGWTDMQSKREMAGLSEKAAANLTGTGVIPTSLTDNSKNINSGLLSS